MAKLVVLAAGDGGRCDNHVKCLLPINGETLLERLCRQFSGHEALVVTGYEADTVKRACDCYGAKTVSNPLWETTDNAYSLSLALDEGGPDDYFVFNGDTVLSNACVPALINSHPNTVVVESKITSPEEMQVRVNSDGRIAWLAKNIHGIGEAFAYYFSDELLMDCYPSLLDPAIKHFEEAVDKHMNNRLMPMYVMPNHAIEIDTWEDYIKAQKMFKGER